MRLIINTIIDNKVKKVFFLLIYFAEKYWHITKEKTIPTTPVEDVAATIRKHTKINKLVSKICEK